jgi:imidazolonepropionase
MTEDIVHNQLKELKKLMNNKELHVNDIDVFCEKGKSFYSSLFLMFNDRLGVYNIEQSRRILLAGKQIGLSINFHGDELNYTGSAEVND